MKKTGKLYVLISNFEPPLVKKREIIAINFKFLCFYVTAVQTKNQMNSVHCFLDLKKLISVSFQIPLLLIKSQKKTFPKKTNLSQF